MTGFAWQVGVLHDSYEEAEVYKDYALARLAEARSAWNINEDHTAIDKLITAGQNICASITSILDKELGSWPHYTLIYALWWCWEYETQEMPEYELDWKKICEAWIANDFEGRAVTIAVIDRMRQILWDEPFYAVWAARPEQQEF